MGEQDDAKRKLLEESRVIAIVGLSPDTARASNVVATYLIAHGYRVIPVNPRYRDILGQKSYPSLSHVTEKVDIVDIFRRAENLMPAVREAVRLAPRAIWLQLGIVNDEARKLAEANNIPFFMNQCIKVEHSRLIGK